VEWNEEVYAVNLVLISSSKLMELVLVVDTFVVGATASSATTQVSVVGSGEFWERNVNGVIEDVATALAEYGFLDDTDDEHDDDLDDDDKDDDNEDDEHDHSLLSVGGILEVQ
jgi:hypothetical protein